MSFAGQEILRQITKSVISSDQVALIIVDMQRGFMPGKDTSELPVPDADTLIEPMNMLIQAAQDAGVKIIYTGDRHTPHSPSFFTTFELEGWAEEHGAPRVIYRGMIPAYIIENVKEGNFNLYPLYSGSGKAVAQLLPDELQKMEACLKEPVNEHTGNSLKLYPSLSPIETFADSQHYLHEKASGNYVLLDSSEADSHIHAFSGSMLIPPHCIENTVGAEFAEGLLPPTTQDKVIYKGGSDHLAVGEVDAKSALIGDRQIFVSELPAYLAENNIKLACVCGVAGDVCAYRTAADLVALSEAESSAFQAIKQNGQLSSENLIKLQHIKTVFMPDLCQPLNPSRFADLQKALRDKGGLILPASAMREAFSSMISRDRAKH